jgi:hypothetical protein
MKKEGKIVELKIEELEERIAPAFLITPPGSDANTQDVFPTSDAGMSREDHGNGSTRAAWNGPDHADPLDIL